MMRARVLFFVALFFIGSYGLVRLRTAAHTAALPSIETNSPQPPAAKLDFTTHVKPILARCQPCHFNGGTMYEKLPFDRPETVTKLGEKLFTRIQAENDRKIIREFLAENSASK